MTIWQTKMACLPGLPLQRCWLGHDWPRAVSAALWVRGAQGQREGLDVNAGAGQWGRKVSTFGEEAVRFSLGLLSPPHPSSPSLTLPHPSSPASPLLTPPHPSLPWPRAWLFPCRCSPSAPHSWQWVEVGVLGPSQGSCGQEGVGTEVSWSRPSIVLSLAVLLPGRPAFLQ
jgi:hypothetical protein